MLDTMAGGRLVVRADLGLCQRERRRGNDPHVIAVAGPQCLVEAILAARGDFQGGRRLMPAAAFRTIRTTTP